MWNIIFIDIDKLNIDFEFPESEETMQDLAKLRDNILKIVGEENTLLVFISNKKLDEIRFNAALLVNYFNAVTLQQDNIVIGNLLTKDTVADVCVRNDANTYYTVSVDDVSQKQFEVIKTIGMENISKLVHITGGIEFFLARKLYGVKNISLYTGYEPSIGKIDHDTTHGKDIIYLSSKEEGIKGYNDCFDTFFQYQKEVHIKKKKNPNNN